MFGEGEKMFFRVIIPTYDRNIEEAVNSVLSQTFNDYVLIVSHDDARAAVIEEKGIINNRIDVYSKERRYNGGNRNYAMTFEKDSLYTLFLDDDDIFINKDLLQKLHDFIEEHGRPDLIRLPYQKKYINEDRIVHKGFKGETDIEKITESTKVAPWTKCVKSNLLVPFPENTLFEDVVQHIKQCDIAETTAVYPDAVVQWRIHDGQASKSNSLKWRSSRWRIIADLMDLELDKPYTKRKREDKLAAAKRQLFIDWERGDD